MQNRTQGVCTKQEYLSSLIFCMEGRGKFFRSQLALAVPVDIVEALMGHEGYLTEAYRRYSKKQMAEYYLKGEHLVTVQMPKEIHEIESEFKEELNKNRKLIEDLILENREIRKENEELKRQIEEINKQLEFLFKVIKEKPEVVMKEIERID